MSESRSCPSCGDALVGTSARGLCKRCLGRLAFARETTFDALPEDFRAPRSKHDSRAFGDYELIDEIARGGMGIVYRARQRSLGRSVALKMLLQGPLASPETIQRFLAEAEAVAQLQHPNIVAIYETGEEEGQHFFSMEYIDGRNLSELVKENPLPAETAGRYVSTIAQAIDYAHSKGILHRDLKPSNVLIDAKGQPRVTDFGLARRLD
jgi:eukaryotic-like serine/threonine-protein kinase